MFSWLKRGRDIKLVCFDIDNTLVDFASAERSAETYMAELISKDIKKAQAKIKKRSNVKNECSAFIFLKTFTEVKIRHLYSDMKPESYSRKMWFQETFEILGESLALGINLNSLIENSSVYEKKYWECVTMKSKNYPNTISTLDYFKIKGYKLATITDSDGLQGMKNKRIKLLGLDKYFDYIITGDDIGLNKPAVENWDKLLELSQLKGKQCVMIGDHPDVDLVTAKKLGFVTVWTKENINNDLHHNYVDYEIKNIKELIGIVENISR